MLCNHDNSYDSNSCQLLLQDNLMYNAMKYMHATAGPSLQCNTIGMLTCVASIDVLNKVIYYTG